MDRREEIVVHDRDNEDEDDNHNIDDEYDS